MKNLRNLLRMTVQGLVLVLPLVITLWVAVWLARGAEDLLGDSLRYLLGDPDAVEGSREWVGHLGLRHAQYVPGMGIALGIILAIAVGILTRFWLVKILVDRFGRVLERIPLVKTLYGSVKDLLGFMGTGEKKTFSRVVLVRLPGSEAKMLGFVTRETLDDIAGLRGLKGRVAVYVSQSYNIGGITLFVPAADVEEIEMTVEDAMRFSLTAGVSVTEDAGRKT